MADIRFKEFAADASVLRGCADSQLLNGSDADQMTLVAVFALRQYSQMDFVEVNRALWQYDPVEGKVTGWAPENN